MNEFNIADKLTPRHFVIALLEQCIFMQDLCSFSSSLYSLDFKLIYRFNITPQKYFINTFQSDDYF